MRLDDDEISNMNRSLRKPRTEASTSGAGREEGGVLNRLMHGLGARLVVVLGALVFLGWLAPFGAQAQVLALFPSCGAAVDPVRVCGSGWAEPVPVCYYEFLFDGTQVAPNQPDGLFGPPDATFNVPSVAAAEYDVTVNLRLSSDDSLLQTVTKPFQVVDVAAQMPLTATSPSTGTIRIEFDPSKTCLPGDCEEIVFIQTRNTRRIRMNGADEHLPYNEAPHSWPNGDAIEATFVNDVAIDRIYGKPVPYYGIPPGAATIGKSTGGGMTTVTARMSDTPRRGDGSYFDHPTDDNLDVVTIKILFEVHVFCAKGDAAGTLLGKITWEWERDKGRADTFGDVTIGAASTSQPSAAFTAALDKWIEKNPAFKLPQQKFPGCF